METVRLVFDEIVIAMSLGTTIYFMQALEKFPSGGTPTLRWMRRIALVGMLGGLLLVGLRVATRDITLAIPAYVFAIFLVVYYVAEILILRRTPRNGGH